MSDSDLIKTITVSELREGSIILMGKAGAWRVIDNTRHGKTQYLDVENYKGERKTFHFEMHEQLTIVVNP